MKQQTQLTKKNDFVEIKYTGYANNEIFDSNIEEDIKKLNPNAQPHKTIIVIGQGMVVPGLDKAMEGKELNKEYDSTIHPNGAFGPRNQTLIKTIPISAFKDHKIIPQAGMVLTLDNYLVKIIAVSGARVIVDFNNPLAGKELKYKFTIIREVTDEKEKVETVLELFFKTIPEFEIREKEIVVKGDKQFEVIVQLYKSRFKELINKELVFEEKQGEKSG